LKIIQIDGFISEKLTPEQQVKYESAREVISWRLRYKRVEEVCI